MSQLPENFADRSVCIMGLGYVGLTLATVMADVGFKVTGVEIREEVLEKFKRREPHFYEPGLKERLGRTIDGEQLTVSRNIPENWKGSVYIITVGTPLGADGKSRMDMIENVSKEVARHLKPGDFVILRSTVKLGTTRNIVLPVLKKSGVDFELAFCPERTLEGKALTELRQLPQIVGGVTLSATIRASQIFQFLTPTVVRISDVETAEMIKLIDNAHRDVMFAYANEVARACDAVGISAAEVINAGRLGYPRTNLPMPGPVGGPCLSKDPHILIEGLREMGIIPEITLSARLINERQPEEVVEYLGNITRKLTCFPDRPVISLLGIAFKGQPSTDDLRGTMARPIFDALLHRFPNAIFKGYDAVVAARDVQEFGLRPCDSLEDAFCSAHLVLILNNHSTFASMSLESLAAKMAGPGLVYDFWNNFKATDLHLPAHVGYLALGSHGKGVLPKGMRHV